MAGMFVYVESRAQVGRLTGTASVIFDKDDKPEQIPVEKLRPATQAEIDRELGDHEAD